jgi:RNA-directed DNA polymerase
MVNTKHDTHSYESTSNGESGYQREIFDGNVLYESFLKAKQGSDWKPQVQKFEMNYLLELADLQSDLAGGSYHFLPNTEFTIHERGKVRAITGEQIRDRVAKHALCDEALTPSVQRFLIYDNSASQTGKGIDFARQRLLTHLRKYYRHHKSNEGYVLLIDFSKYYDNIQHDVLMEQFRKYVHNENALNFLQRVIDRSKVDVSYMTEEEYAGCMDTLFNSLEYERVDKALLTGRQYMRKHLNIGDQVAQVAGIIYPIPIDNYVKIVRGVKYYGRYMDDSYAIHESKEFLEELLQGIMAIAKDLGITVNTRKTRICKLSSMWRFLQVQYSLTETGRVIQKINPKRLTAMRRKMKKLVHVLNEREFQVWFDGWMGSHYKTMSKQQRENMNTLCNQLKEVYHNVHNHTE